MEKGNATLYALRQEHELRLHEATGGIGISSLHLYLLERGYLPISTKWAARFASFYSVDASEFVNLFGYPTPIEKAGEDTPKVSKLKAFLFSWKAVVLSFVLTALCAGLFAFGYEKLVATHENESSQSYYSQDYISLLYTVQQKGTAFGDSTSLVESDESGNSLTVTMESYTHLLGWTSFDYSFVDTTGTLALSFQEKSEDLTFSYTESDANDKTLSSGSGLIVKGVYELTSVKDANFDPVTDKEVIAAKNTLLAPYPEKCETLYRAWSVAASFSNSLRFEEMIETQHVGALAQAKDREFADNTVLSTSLLGTLFFGVSLILLGFTIAKKKKKEPLAIKEAIPEVSYEEVRPLKKNLAFGPFIPEFVLRFAALSIILTSSILLFRLAYGLFNSGDLMEAILELYLNLDSITLFVKLQHYMVVATLLWFFVRLEILSRTGNIIPQVLSFAVFGALYYVAIGMMDFYLQDTSDLYRSALLLLLEKVMPGNLFWGIGAFSLIVLFLNTTPNFTRKSSLVIWRLCSIIPMAYLLLSYFYSIGTALWGWTKWDEAWANLLFRKQFSATAFAIVYPFSIFVLRLILRKRYGESNAAIYFSGNRYFWIKNLIAAFWIGAMALFAYLMKDSSYARTLNLSQVYWIVYLIPLALLYHPHLGKRNATFDLAVSFVYLVSFSFAYVYLARYLLF